MGSYFLKAYIKRRIYYNTEAEFEDIRLNLKHNPCPHCRNRGCLILHGYLFGYTEDTSSEVIKRGHRVFCSNRRTRERKGCGRTFSVLISGFIKNHIISAKSVWKLLDKIQEDMSLVRAIRSSDSHIQETGIYRIFRKFKDNQVKIRTFLMSIKDPPSLKHTKDSVIQTIEHLKSAFPDTVNPISGFQHHFQTSFL
jgi:hypothetical protein